MNVEPYFSDDMVTLYHGDCLAILPSLPDSSIDAIVTDPPYGLEFMGREWDGADGFRRSLNTADAGRDNVFGRTSRTSPEYKTGKPSGARIRKPSQTDQSSSRAHNETTSLVARNAPEAYIAGRVFQDWCEAWARECLRVLKPGGYLLAFGGTRTWHRLVCGIEDAGFEIRGSTADLTGREAPGLMWIYGQGMPKNLDAGRAVDMHLCPLPGRHFMRRVPVKPRPDDHVCAETEEGDRWRGWGTSDKPAWEPVAVARKPLSGTLGRNLTEHGVGALNIDGCRVEHASEADLAASKAKNPGRSDAVTSDVYGTDRPQQSVNDAGRWPPNVLLTHGEDCRPAGMRQVRGCGGPKHTDNGDSSIFGLGQPGHVYGERGLETVEAWDCAEGCPVAEIDRQSGTSVSRVGKPRRSAAPGDGWGMTHTGTEYADTGGASRYFPVFRYEAKADAAERPKLPDGTAWPTVKPIPLIRWLVRLVTPPGGKVLDLFAGTGGTGEACIIEGFPCVLIEKDPVAAELIMTRLRKPIQPDLFGGAA